MTMKLVPLQWLEPGCHLGTHPSRPEVAFEAYATLSNVWRFALIVARFQDLQNSFLTVLKVWAVYQKKKKNLVANIAI